MFGLESEESRITEALVVNRKIILKILCNEYLIFLSLCITFHSTKFHSRGDIIFNGSHGDILIIGSHGDITIDGEGLQNVCLGTSSL